MPLLSVSNKSYIPPFELHGSHFFFFSNFDYIRDNQLMLIMSDFTSDECVGGNYSPSQLPDESFHFWSAGRGFPTMGCIQSLTISIDER